MILIIILYTLYVCIIYVFIVEYCTLICIYSLCMHYICYIVVYILFAYVDVIVSTWVITSRNPIWWAHFQTLTDSMGTLTERPRLLRYHQDLLLEPATPCQPLLRHLLFILQMALTTLKVCRPQLLKYVVLFSFVNQQLWNIEYAEICYKDFHISRLSILQSLTEYFAVSRSNSPTHGLEPNGQQRFLAPLVFY